MEEEKLQRCDFTEADKLSKTNTSVAFQDPACTHFLENPRSLKPLLVFRFLGSNFARVLNPPKRIFTAVSKTKKMVMPNQKMEHSI